MGNGENRDYFSRINGNLNIVEEFPRPGMGMGMKSWEWVHENPSRTSLYYRHQSRTCIASGSVALRGLGLNN